MNTSVSQTVYGYPKLVAGKYRVIYGSLKQCVRREAMRKKEKSKTGNGEEKSVRRDAQMRKRGVEKRWLES